MNKEKEMLEDINRMLIVLKALTPPDAEGMIVLNRWIEKYKEKKQ